MAMTICIFCPGLCALGQNGIMDRILAHVLARARRTLEERVEDNLKGRATDHATVSHRRSLISSRPNDFITCLYLSKSTLLVNSHPSCYFKSALSPARSHVDEK